MNHLQRFIIPITLIINSLSYGMLTVHTTKHSSPSIARASQSSCKPLIHQSKVHTGNLAPLDADFFDTIPNLTTLEKKLKERYQTTRQVLMDKYVADQKAFLAFEKAHINHIKTVSFKEDCPDATIDPELPTEIVKLFQEHACNLDINPNSISLVIDKTDSTVKLSAISPILAFRINRPKEEKLKEEQGLPFFMHVISLHTENPAKVSFTVPFLNALYEGAMSPTIFEWCRKHEFIHLGQHHGLFGALLFTSNSVTQEDGYWKIDKNKDSIKPLLDQGINLYETKDYVDFLKAQEEQADLLPLTTYPSLSKRLANHISEIESRPEIYLSPKQLKIANEAILDCWTRESSSPRPMPLMYE